MENITAICIPRVDQSITKHFIFKTFCNLKIGFIENIYEMPFYEKYSNHTEISASYKRVIIRIKWNNEPNAEFILSRFKSGKSVKVVYDMPWYWICLPNRPHMKTIQNVEVTTHSQK